MTMSELRFDSAATKDGSVFDGRVHERAMPSEYLAGEALSASMEPRQLALVGAGCLMAAVLGIFRL